jgi:octaprenyl-diphosphate synthase
MVADGSVEVLYILSRASSVIAEGEVHQLITTNDTDTTEQDYLEVIEAKTAFAVAAPRLRSLSSTTSSCSSVAV